MKYCKKCIMPSTRPEQVFKQGICDACWSAEEKHLEIDWSARRSEFETILQRYRGTGENYDCIIPVSGGKDSCYQAITMRDEYGMTPLCVTHTPCELTEVGLKNLNFLRDEGFGAETLRDGLERCLRKFCTIRKGRQSPEGSRDHGSEDRLDEKLYRKAQKTIWLSSRDGASNEANAFVKAAYDGLLPQLLMASWDGSH